jgi:hypothetical protein
LGEHALHPLVQSCRLLPNETVALDSPLDINELDKSVLEGKNNTAGGPDGLNNKF